MTKIERGGANQSFVDLVEKLRKLQQEMKQNLAEARRDVPDVPLPHWRRGLVLLRSLPIHIISAIASNTEPETPLNLWALRRMVDHLHTINQSITASIKRAKRE